MFFEGYEKQDFSYNRFVPGTPRQHCQEMLRTHVCCIKHVNFLLFMSAKFICKSHSCKIGSNTQ